MSLPALIDGAECGPVNPLQALSKQFERGRGIQQDHFGPGRVGPSKEVFRTQSVPVPGLEEEAARFFSGQPANSAFTPQHVPNAFDLSALRGSLPTPQSSVHSPPSAWAEDFLHQPIMQAANPQLPSDLKPISFNAPGADRMETQHRPQVPGMNNTFFSRAFRPSMEPLPVYREVGHPEFPSQSSEAESAIIHAHFPPEEVKHQEPSSEAIDADELSRTAGLLIDNVKNELNPKFQNSAFLGLMRQLRDKEIVVEGNDIVESPPLTAPAPAIDGWAHKFTNLKDLKGKGKAKDVNEWADAFQESTSASLDISNVAAPAQEPGRRHLVRSESIHGTMEEQSHQQGSYSSHVLPTTGLSTPRKSVHFDPQEVLDTDTVPELVQGGIESEEDEYWRQENAAYMDYWLPATAGASRQERPPVATPEWDRLQAAWDRLEATATGIKAVSIYHFQPINPYVLGDSSTRNHDIHTQRAGPNQSVLEKEAAVQNDLRNPVAWFELGVKQQENEREISAIKALQRAVALKPSYLEAWLALAISNTNENDRNGAYDAIEQWVRNNGRYEGARLMALPEDNGEKAPGVRRAELIQCLMGLARTAPEGEIDADIQTALGVLLNTGEDYEKAQDCFRTALAVRPNDWLLYNRVGATLANSGRADEALWYYYRALELNPSYIRARFNLGISCINMKRFEEAAEHILDALVLQENDAAEGADTRGITSSALWDCLRTTCIQLQRTELALLCDERDLEGFRKVVWT